MAEMKKHRSVMRHAFGDQNVNALKQLRAARVGVVHWLRDRHVDYVVALRFIAPSDGACARHHAQKQEDQRKEKHASTCSTDLRIGFHHPACLLPSAA
jgi:hypothetical protein